MWAAERERVKYETWVGAWGSLQRCLLFWFVSFWFCFNVFVCLFVFLLRGHWQFTNTLVFPGVQRSRRKAATKTMENVDERVGKKMLPFWKTSATTTEKWIFFSCYSSELWDRTVSSCSVGLCPCCVHVHVMDFLKACLFSVDLT